MMRTRTIGSLEVSVVGLGTNNFSDFFGQRCDQEDATRVINAALDAGVTLIDTAEEYSVVSQIGTGYSEEFIGVALRGRRDEAIIATKFSNTDLEHPDERGAARIIAACEGSLRRLQTDHIDLYQQHFRDPETPTEEILTALDQLVRQGKVREIGCSNHNGEMIDAARSISAERGLAPFVSAQNGYNLIDAVHMEGVLEACERHDMKLLPFFPLASGLLTGKYRRGEALPDDSRLGSDAGVASFLRERYIQDEQLAKVEQLEQFARDHGHTLLELAFSWLASQPVVGSIIAGATKPEQIVANAAAASWELTESDFRDLAPIVG